MPVVAPLIGAAVTVGGSLLSSSAQKKAGNAAAAAQTAGDMAAIDEQRRQFDITQGNFAPWLNAGKTALGQQGDLIGINGAPAQQSSIDQLMASPLYQSLFRNGQNTVLANASATGGLRGGNIENSLANFGSDTLAQVIQSQLGNLGGLSGQGQNAAGSLGTLGANTANNIGAYLQNSGAAQGQAALYNGAVGANNINNIAGAIGGVVGNTAIQKAVGKLF